MESIIFIIIIAVATLLRSGAKKGQQRPTPPRRQGPAPPRRQGPNVKIPEFLREENLETLFMGKNDSEKVSKEPKFTKQFSTKEQVKKRIPPKISPLLEVEKEAMEDVSVNLSSLIIKNKSDLARGIVLAEILGPPISKRKNDNRKFI